MTHTSPSSMDGLEPKMKEKIIALCKAIIPDASIWVYGSRARGTYKERSDIDLALTANRPISYFEIAELKDVLREANIPYLFDIVDIEGIRDEEFKNAVKSHMVLWKQ